MRAVLSLWCRVLLVALLGCAVSARKLYNEAMMPEHTNAALRMPEPEEIHSEMPAPRSVDDSAAIPGTHEMQALAQHSANLLAHKDARNNYREEIEKLQNQLATIKEAEERTRVGVQAETKTVEELSRVNSRIQQQIDAARTADEEQRKAKEETERAAQLALEVARKQEQERIRIAAQPTLIQGHIETNKREMDDSQQQDMQALLGTQSTTRDSTKQISLTLQGLDLQATAQTRAVWTSNSLEFAATNSSLNEKLFEFDLGLLPTDSFSTLQVSLEVKGLLRRMAFGLTDGDRMWLIQQQPESSAFYPGIPASAVLNTETQKPWVHHARTHAGNIRYTFTATVWGTEMAFTSEHQDTEIAMVAPNRPNGLGSNLRVVGFRTTPFDAYKIDKIDLTTRVNPVLHTCPSGQEPTLLVANFENANIQQDGATWVVDQDSFKSGGPYTSKQLFFHRLCLSVGSHELVPAGVWQGASLSIFQGEKAVISKERIGTSKAISFAIRSDTSFKFVPVRSYSSECPNGCSGHGVCDSGVCNCEFGFGGSDCNRVQASCNGCQNGVCNIRSGVCACDTFWKGEHCDQRACAQDCSGHGVCMELGKCKCDKPFAGAACSRKLRACPNQCSAHGQCDDGVCKCDAPFTGLDCSATTTKRNDVDPEVPETDSENPETKRKFLTTTEEQDFNAKIDELHQILDKQMGKVHTLESKLNELQKRKAELLEFNKKAQQ